MDGPERLSERSSVAPPTEEPPPVYAEREPVAGLRGLVRRLWYLDASTPGGVERILPIPFVHAIVNLGEPYEVLRRGDEPVGQVFTAGFVSGLQSRPLVNRNPAHLHHVGAELEPFAWRTLGMEPFADDVRPASRVLPSLDGVRADVHARSSHDPAQRALDLLEAVLLDAASGPAPDRGVVAVTAALAAEPGMRVGVAAAAAGVPASSLAARFRRATARTAKAHADVLRFHRFLDAISRPGPLPTWTEMVAQTTYYDQAHFIRAFTRLAGVAPREYLRVLGEDGRAAPSFVHAEE